jgi:cobalt/nickel transport system ATP-binding protein
VEPPVTRLRVDGLGYHYPAGGPVLRDVSLDVAPGGRLAVLGPNGAGKSTLLLHLNGLLLPGAGRVVVDDTPVEEGTLREVRRKVGLVFQDPEDQLFLPTLLEDVAFGPMNDGASADAARESAAATLAALGLGHAAHRAAHHLSGGEKRLAALATVLVMRPGLLVLDEPTAGLDARSRARVAGILRRRAETLVLATHDLEVAAALCDRGVVLSHGRVAAFGDLHDLLADDALLRAHGLDFALEPHTGGADAQGM